MVIVLMHKIRWKHCIKCHLYKNAFLRYTIDVSSLPNDYLLCNEKYIQNEREEISM